jgi:hypothetical protein
MAGAFGFERGEHYDVSIRVGERVLLPSVRSAAKDTLIIADGFSCREQIAQTTDRRALHSAQVLRMALRGDSGTRQYPELPYIGAPARLHITRKTALFAAAVVASALMWRLRKAKE